MAGVNLTFDIFGHDRTASRALRGVGDSAEKTHGKLGKFGKVGKAAGLAVAGGIGLAAGAVAAAVPVLASWTKNAAEDEKAQRRLAVALKNTAGANKSTIAGVEDWISKVGVATGVTDDEMRPALQRLVQATHDVGDAQDLMKVALDASAGSGKSLESVTTAMAKAQNGNMGALSRLGIKIKDADGKTLSFKETVAQMADTFKGQMAKSADSFDGKMSRLKLVMDETKETVGAALLPALNNLGGWLLDKGIPALKSMGEQVMPKVRAVFESVKKAVDDNRPALEQLGRILVNVGKWVLDNVVPAFLKLEGFIWKGLIVAIAGLGKVIPPLVSGFLRGLAQIVGGFRGLFTAVTAVLGGILTVAEKTMGWIPGIGDKIRKAKDGFESFRSSAIDKLRKVESGLTSAADKVDAFGRKAKNVPEAKIKANIADLTTKLSDAKTKLADPNLTKDRKAHIKADIAQLKREIAEARRQMASVKNKTVTLDIHTVRTGDGRKLSDGRASGGLVTGPGTATSDSIPMWLSDGEYVIRSAAVKRIGVGRLNALNALGGVGDSAMIPGPRGGSIGAGGEVVALHVHVHAGTVLQSAQQLGDLVYDALRDKERRSGRRILAGVAR